MPIIPHDDDLHRQTILARAQAARISAVLYPVQRLGTVAIIGYFTYKSVAVFAGKTTFASIIIQITASLRIRDRIELGVSVGAIVWAMVERHLRRKIQLDYDEYLNGEEEDDTVEASLAEEG